MSRERKSKRRMSLDCPADLISDLPRDVIDSIVERLPLRDAARLSVLSCKWRDIWLSIPCLCFSRYFFATVLREKIHVTHEFASIVSKIIIQHAGPVYKFALVIPSLDHQPDIIPWMMFLSRSVIREFSLENLYRFPLVLSSHLFTFAGLEKLKLHHCEFNPPSNFKGFRRLVVLELLHVKFREGTFEDLISRCPLLERLSLIKCLGIEHVNVDALDLKHLIVDGIFRSLRVKHAKELVSVAIVLEKLTKICHKTSLCDLMGSLASSGRLEKLCLGGSFVKVLFNDCSVNTNLETLRHLELRSICLDNLEYFTSAVRAVQKCPRIRYLNICVNSSSNLDVWDYFEDVTFDHLQEARVGISRASTTELKLIKLLLGGSPVLEKLTLTFLKEIKGSYQSRMLNQLIRFRRASPKVEVICPDPMITVESSEESGSDSELSSEYSGSSDTSSSSTDSDSDG